MLAHFLSDIEVSLEDRFYCICIKHPSIPGFNGVYFESYFQGIYDIQAPPPPPECDIVVEWIYIYIIIKPWSGKYTLCQHCDSSKDRHQFIS